MANRYSNITVRENNQQKKVVIGSELKPEIESSIIKKWQSLIDAAAKLTDVPSALIMKLNEETIEVFLKSDTEGNPYEQGEHADLVYGLYCETVIGTQDKLLIPDAIKSKIWKENNPDVDINMISYLGFPINWPDGEVFGTVCLLDSKENHYQQLFNDYLYQVKLHIETDLKLLVKNQELDQLNKVKSRFLSLISHDIRGSVGTINLYLKLLLERVFKMDRHELYKGLKSLYDDSKSTHQMLEDLLVWSKQDLFSLEPIKEEMDLLNLIEKTLAYLQPEINLKELEIIKNFSAKRTIVFADKKMVETALRNILSNSIYYTQSKGKIHIQLNNVKDRLSLEIEDSGIGMSKEELDNLFELKNEDSSTGGAGIGLIITKDFLDKNDTEIIVQSKEKVGTKFLLSFKQ